MTRLDTGRRELRSFSAEVKSGAARNLRLLRDIESTLAWLDKLSRQLRTDADFAENFKGIVFRFEEPVDPDHVIQENLEKAQSAINDLYEVLVSKRQSARFDRRLEEEDGVEAAYTETIAQAADLHNAINDLRWAIGEHDIDVGSKKLSREFSCENIAELFDQLDAA